jgi:putative ATP-binding cassette transporter
MRQDLRSLVLGFKELRLNAARRRAVLAGLHLRAEATLAAIASANRRQTAGYVLQATAMLAASGACVFAVPNLLHGVDAVTMISAAVLMSNISLALVRDVPLLARAEAAIGEMEQLHAALRPPGWHADPAPVAEAPRGDAAPLVLDGVCYQYPDEDQESGFAFGPVSIEFPPGTVTFVLGGNSAGKTTLIKLAAGLYAPTLGEVRLGGVAIAPARLRESVSAIFSDPYIFDRLYGWPDADAGAVNGMLADMGIGGRTRFADGRFSSVDLSTGQRKRLAWVIAMIEARPILLLDQWAADQDPEFREHFYRVMLPGLRAAGRTVIAVTNDDRYYDAADRLIRMDDGMLVQ